MIIEQIKSLNANSTKEEIIKLIKTDFKIFSSENENVKSIIAERPMLEYSNRTFSSNIGKYFKYRRVDGLIEENNKRNKEKRTTFDCDKCTEIIDIYKELGWKYSKGSDTINSFATTYSCGLAIYYPSKYKIGTDNSILQINNEYCSLRNAPYFYISNYADLNELDYMEEFACLTHSFGNFMPSLYETYNKDKGISKDIKDYIDLMLKYIKEYYPTLISKYICTELCLEDYINLDNLEIKPLFRRSKNSALPKNEDELRECICEMNRRIKVRGLRIIMKINKDKKVLKVCDELIRSMY